MLGTAPVHVVIGPAPVSSPETKTLNLMMWKNYTQCLKLARTGGIYVETLIVAVACAGLTALGIKWSLPSTVRLR